LWSAYQHFEESIKGSIEIGKQADFVILDNNPITIFPKEIKNIKILETINDDKVVYSSAQ
jgi:predicted amidohydrolase YtcJ